jgi:2-dehydropantoate 2-reductase
MSGDGQVARIAVVGAGGVGGLVAARLALAGNDVRVLARGATLDAIRAHGLRLRGPDGDFTARVAVAASEAAALGEVDFVLVAVKTWQLADMAPRLVPLVGEHTIGEPSGALRLAPIVVPLQNGVEAAGRLAAALGDARVVGGLCAMLSWAERPGEIKWIGGTPMVTLGARRPEQAAAVAACSERLRGAGLRVEIASDIDRALWSKLLFIAPLGAVGAVEGAAAGALRRAPAVRARLEAAMYEVAAVAAARGVALAPDAVAVAMRRIDQLPEDATASLQRDIAAGRPSELHELIGAVVRLGQEAHVETPVSAGIYAALLPLEARARSS